MITETNMKTILDSPNSNELFEVYFSEGSRGLLPKHNVNKEIFYKMEQAGLTDCFGVFDIFIFRVGVIYSNHFITYTGYGKDVVWEMICNSNGSITINIAIEPNSTLGGWLE